MDSSEAGPSEEHPKLFDRYLTAVLADSTDELEALIKAESPNLNEIRDEVDSSLLDYALDNQLADTTRVLIKAGLDPRDKMHEAIGDGDVGMVIKLLAAGANPNLKPGIDCEPPLHLAAMRKDKAGEAMVRALLVAGADPTVKYNYKFARGVASEDVKMFLDAWSVLERRHGVSIEQAAIARHISIKLKDRAMLAMTRAQMTFPNQPVEGVGCWDQSLQYYYYLAHAVTKARIFEECIIAKLHPNEKLKDDETILHQSSREGNIRKVTALLFVGADLHATTQFGGCTPLHEAARNGHTLVVKKLLDAGALPNGKYKKYRSPLHEAAQAGHEDVVKLLLAAGANPRLQTMKEKYLPADLARKNSHMELATVIETWNGAGQSEDV